jgi:beta-ureidopropionase / N-carbamoyl-L-amino-acid hydrolase
MTNSRKETTMIDRTRLLGSLEELSHFGRSAGGGVCRLAASKEDGQARDWFVARLRHEGLEVAVDPVGNIFGVARLAGADAPVVLTGSHLDSQPSGGRYDGAYGVVAGLEALLAIRRRAAAGGIVPARNIGVVSWTNEEGARFSPSTLGSAVFAGLAATDFAHSRTDGDGVTLGEALAAIGYRGEGHGPRDVSAYVETHIEQGPLLERAGCRIGVVEGNWGTAKYVGEIHGRAAHTGPTPMAERRDALLPAAELVLFIRRLSDETGGALLSSVGRLDVLPNSTNVVAAQVRLFAEFRAVDPAMLALACERLEAKARAVSTPDVTVELVRTVDRPAGAFDERLRALIEDAAQACGYPPLRLSTVAGHDAIPMKAVCPSAMIFVPSAGGVSHHESEFTAPEDLVAGAEVLAETLARLVTE